MVAGRKSLFSVLAAHTPVSNPNTFTGSLSQTSVKWFLWFVVGVQSGRNRCGLHPARKSGTAYGDHMSLLRDV